MTELNDLDIDKLVMGIRLAVIDDLIEDLEALKYRIKELDRASLVKRISKIK